MQAVAANEQASAEFRKNRDKLIKLMHECQGLIKLPPEYAGAMNWAAMEQQMKAELPKYKNKLPSLIAKCNGYLATGRDYFSAKRSIIQCVDAIGSMLGYSGFQIGIYLGMLDKILADPYYQANLPTIVARIFTILNE